MILKKINNRIYPEYFDISFKNSNTGNTIIVKLLYNIKINQLRNKISTHVYNNFNLNDNEFEIVQAGTPLRENNDSIDENENDYFFDRYRKACFYIRPKNNQSNENNENNTCSICYENIIHSIRQLPCNHHFCRSCLINWDTTCRNNLHNTTCPCCRSIIFVHQ